MAVTIDGGGVDTSTLLQKTNNLSDLTNVVDARSNLGLGSVATSNTSDFDAAGSAAAAQAAAEAYADTLSVYKGEKSGAIFTTSDLPNEGDYGIETTRGELYINANGVIQVSPLHNDYTRKVLFTQSANMVAYWPLILSCGDKACDLYNPQQYGVLTNRSILGGTFLNNDKVAYFDGTTWINFYSAAIAANMNMAEFTISVWTKIESAQWTDGSGRTAVSIGNNATTDIIRIQKQFTNNNYIINYTAGSVAKSVTFAGGATTWQHLAMTVSASSDEMKVYLNGVQQGSTQTSLGTFSGGIGSTFCVVGNNFTTLAQQAWIGQLAHVTIWNTQLSAAQLLELSSVGGGYIDGYDGGY